jgi:hypothetical protein
MIIYRGNIEPLTAESFKYGLAFTIGQEKHSVKVSRGLEWRAMNN